MGLWRMAGMEINARLRRYAEITELATQISAANPSCQSGLKHVKIQSFAVVRSGDHVSGRWQFASRPTDAVGLMHFRQYKFCNV